MDKKIHEVHEEVVHYTTAAGLSGIVTTKTLWASHTSFLNDSEEVVGFFDRVLPKLLQKPLDQYFNEARQIPSFQLWSQALGEDPFDYLLDKIVKTYKVVQLSAHDHYVLSFCTASDPWVSDNGLLSQWRAYGSDGGYAIVFEPSGLDTLFTAESRRYYEEGMMWADAQYRLADPSTVNDEDIQKMISEIQKSSYEFFKTLDSEAVGPSLQNITNLSTICKHQGFAEEREVRIIVSESGVAVGADLNKSSNLPDRVIRHYVRDGVAVPYISLFESQQLKTLPIKRVIIGPHPNKLERKRAVEILLSNNGIRADVTVSDTPYRGR
jgi:hypothetical protein